MEDLEILSHLTAKTIYKFKSVCKRWLEFSTEEFFIKKQCSNMRFKDVTTVFLQPGAYFHSIDDPRLQVCSNVLSSSYEESSSDVSPRVVDSLAKSGRILASKGGLVCCRRNNNSKEAPLFVCNLADRSWVEICMLDEMRDNIKHAKVVFDFGGGSKDDFSLNYKLMVFMRDTDCDWDSYTLQCRIYLSRERIWKDGGDVACGSRNMFQTPVFSNGIVYFISDALAYLAKCSPYYWPYIVGFEPKIGKSKLLMLPKKARKGIFKSQLRLFEWNNTVCLVQFKKNACYMWVLKDYNSSSWSLMLNKRVKAMGIMESNPRISGFTLLNNRFLLLATDQRVYRYDLTSNDESTGGGNERARVLCRNKFGKHVDHVVFHSYSSTLCPCGDGATSMLV